VTGKFGIFVHKAGWVRPARPDPIPGNSAGEPSRTTKSSGPVSGHFGSLARRPQLRHNLPCGKQAIISKPAHHLPLGLVPL
jgi:hypothetical protein